MRVCVFSIGATLALLGCSKQDFVGEDGFYAFAMSEDSAPYLVVEDAVLYMVEQRVELPIVAPTDDEMAELMLEQPVPFPRMPWVRLGDLRLEVDFVVTNLTDEARTVAVTLNGFNEFHEFIPSFEVSRDEIIPGFSQWERNVSVPPYGAFAYTIQEEELDEVAVDLATVVNGAPNANLILYFENQSGLDPRAQPYIPAVIPGLTGFRIGIRTAAAAPMVMEVSVRAKDEGDRLEDQDEAWELPVPEIFMPIVEEE